MTVEELYEVFEDLRPHRRHVAARLLSARSPAECLHEPACEAARARLVHAHDLLEALPGHGTQRELSVDGRELRLTLDYEFQELERDILSFEQAASGVEDRLRVPASPVEEIREVLGLIAGRRYAAVFTDRDGTIANYCGRYRSSHQPFYAAVRIGRFARSCVGDFFVVSSGPLYGHGLLSLSAFPEGTVHLAGSKGREYVLADGSAGSHGLRPEQRAALIALDERVQRLLESGEYRILTAIGSGYQRKFGQLTVSRQDIHRSVPVEVSERFLDQIRTAVAEVDPQGRWFELDDTGFDVELTLIADGGDARGFDKGDGVAFLLQTLGVDVHTGPVLVCGDTASDLPMLERLAATGAETHAVFFAADPETVTRVRRLATRSAFCSGPDVLVTAMGIAGEGEPA